MVICGLVLLQVFRHLGLRNIFVLVSKILYVEVILTTSVPLYLISKVIKNFMLTFLIFHFVVIARIFIKIKPFFFLSWNELINQCADECITENIQREGKKDSTSLLLETKILKNNDNVQLLICILQINKYKLDLLIICTFLIQQLFSGSLLSEKNVCIIIIIQKFEDYLGDVGGIFGLYTGASIISLIEIVLFIPVLVCKLYRTLFH